MGGVVVAFTPAANLPSINVMKRVGMRRERFGRRHVPPCPAIMHVREALPHRWGVMVNKFDVLRDCAS